MSDFDPAALQEALGGEGLTLRQLVAAALLEDLDHTGDITSDSVFGADHQGRAVVVAKEAGVLSGGEVFQLVFELLGGVEVRQLIDDGASVAVGDRAFELSGGVRALLSGERTALNFLQRLSGIATLTARFVAESGGRIAICDTRKTTPLWRDLEKHAVKCGGGTNHRFGLFDMIMLKDTHADGAGGLAEALRRVAPLRPKFKVAAEARNLDEVRAALAAEADLLMLDNMDEATLREALALINKSIPTEVTGGITAERIRALSELGIDRVSIGALTHSAKALDFSMRLEV